VATLPFFSPFADDDRASHQHDQAHHRDASRANQRTALKRRLQRTAAITPAIIVTAATNTSNALNITTPHASTPRFARQEHSRRSGTTRILVPLPA
jgi:hypothetical protein